MHMIRELAQHEEISKIPISGIGGVETWRDVVEFILLGATSVQVCTAVMHYGFGIVREMEAGLLQFMDDKGYNTIYDFAGKALPNVTEWKHLNLKHKVVAEINSSKCVGCELCYIACDDGAHQAIALSEDRVLEYRVLLKKIVWAVTYVLWFALLRIVLQWFKKMMALNSLLGMNAPWQMTYPLHLMMIGQEERAITCQNQPML